MEKYVLGRNGCKVRNSEIFVKQDKCNTIICFDEAQISWNDIFSVKSQEISLPMIIWF